MNAASIAVASVVYEIKLAVFDVGSLLIQTAPSNKDPTKTFSIRSENVGRLYYSICTLFELWGEMISSARFELIS